MSASRLQPSRPNLRAVVRRPASEKELQRLFRLRAQVFFGEGVLTRNARPVLTDELDHSPTAINLVAMTPEEDMIGGARVAFPTGDWVPTKTDYFDFRQLLPDEGRTTSCGSFLWVSRTHRRSRLATILIRSTVALSAVAGMSHYCAAARPEVAAFLEPEGWRIAANEFFHPIERVPVVPLIFDLSNRIYDAEYATAGQSEIRVDEPAISFETTTQSTQTTR